MRRLLVIDDHDDIRENTAEILMLGGYHVVTAPNGKKGVELALQQPPELVICDIMMPELDGYGVLHLLRKNEATRDIPFIFLTAKTERADFRKGMEMGADDYITKPFDDIELLNAIDIRLKKYDILHGKYAGDEKGGSEMIADLSASGVIHLDASTSETLELSRKMSLYQEGKRPKYLYLLKSGKVKAFRINEDGKEYITNLYVPGDYIGYLPLLENKSYEDNAIVLEDAELALFPREEFLEAIYRDMQVSARFIQLIARNVREKEERLLSLAYGSLRKRIARGLLDIHHKFAGEPGKSLSMSREDIAQYVGTATESLIRTLSDFKSEKLIDITDGKIRITDVSKLENLLY
ncbi:response regulator [Dinghuibacter silviterrae]|uniref:CRP-like cAMP-binding protein n=1 Tax=Dinghuibacter silviterrae TaxID=1539049 RepID=A0A4R8DI98_9BACT|nr:response regulator [Dinghuibacter silviterrae]TDW96690.1 CRP-like cAMP-binding protein [Dinghuibacter silviterrae]